LREIQDRVEVLDELYAQLRQCRRLCGGRRGLVDHRPVGQGRRRPDGEPDHECDERCVPHRCKGASASAVHQIHAILHRAFGFGVKWRWMDRNPAAASGACASTRSAASRHAPNASAVRHCGSWSWSASPNQLAALALAIRASRPLRAPPTAPCSNVNWMPSSEGETQLARYAARVPETKLPLVSGPGCREGCMA
jgi:hypothetical protein